VTSVPQILLVDGGEEQRATLRQGLDALGCETIEVPTVASAVEALRQRPAISAVVLEGQVGEDADPSVVAQVVAARPDVKVIVRADRPPLPGAIAVAPDDRRSLEVVLGPCADAIDLGPTTAEIVEARVEEITARWRELCLWDPAQPPDAEPAVPDLLLGAIVDALRHPQPIGWGLDPALDDVVDRFAEQVETPDQAIAQLSCLRRALHEVVVPHAPEHERSEALERVSAVLDQTMMTGAALRTSRLRDEALTDALTGLGNRRAFDRDLERDIARARRTSSPLTLAVIDLDGLKRINDTDGHAAGDRAIASMGHALRATARRSDRAYRIGGDEFAVILSDALLVEPELLVQRLREAGAPTCSVGTASSPPEPIEELFERADAALYRNRAASRGG